MTCIVGWAERNTVWIGADSAGTDWGLGQKIRADEKVFINEEFIFGVSGSYRLLNLLRYQFHPPEQNEKQENGEYMRVNFINSITNFLEKNKYAKIVDNEIQMDSHFLVGYRGKLYKIENDFQVGEHALCYNACGCGDDLALGALYVLQDKKTMKPDKKLLWALNAAAEFSAGVKGPFHILWLEYMPGGVK